jgi:hypothetical protein
MVDEAKALRNELWVMRITSGLAFVALIVSTLVRARGC